MVFVSFALAQLQLQLLKCCQPWSAEQRVGLQGFDENMMAMLKQQYPARLMPQLVQSSQATLQVPLQSTCIS